MNIAMSLAFALIFLVMGLFSLISVFTLIKAFINIKNFDELQRNAVYESLAVSFFIIMGIHLLQLVLSSIAPDPLSTFFKLVISPGAIHGTLIGNAPLHWDSFFMDSFILGVVYYIKRKKYGLI